MMRSPLQLSLRLFICLLLILSNNYLGAEELKPDEADTNPKQQKPELRGEKPALRDPTDIFYSDDEADEDTAQQPVTLRHASKPVDQSDIKHRDVAVAAKCKDCSPCPHWKRDQVLCENEQLFLRRIIKSVLHQLSPPQDSSFMYTAEAHIVMDIDRHNVLSKFVSTEQYNKSIQEVADIMADSIKYRKMVGDIPENESLLTQYKETITTIMQIQLIILMSGTLVYATFRIWSRVGMTQFLIYLCITSFIVSVPWTWVHEHKKNLAERLQRANHLQDMPECNPNKLTWTQYLFHNYNRDCDKFYEDMTIDPLWETKPTMAIAVTFVEFVWKPLGIMGEAPGKFLDDFLRPFPFYMKLVVSFILLIFVWMVMVIYSGRRIMLLSGWLFTIEPANTAQHQLNAINNTIGELRALIDQSGQMTEQRDGEVIDVLKRITDETERQGQTLERITEQSVHQTQIVSSLETTMTRSLNIKEQMTQRGDGDHRMAEIRYGGGDNDISLDDQEPPEIAPQSLDDGGAGDSFVVLPREDNSIQSGGGYRLSRPDHLVINTEYPEEICKFYEKLGMSLRTFGNGRKALHFNQFKINIHKRGEEIIPHAELAVPGTLDLCIVCDCDIQTTLKHLEDRGVEIDTRLADVERTGALGPIRSVYLRDPDKNLIELAHYTQSNYEKKSKMMDSQEVENLKSYD